MSPIDDELRAALRGRADAISPAPDPLGGIESRARGIRRRRAGATIAGAALAVAAVAIAVPTLTASGDKTPSVAAPSKGALPANALRREEADAATTDAGDLAAVVSTWAGRHPGQGPVYLSRLSAATVGDPDPISYAILQVWHDGGQAYGVVAQNTDAEEPLLVHDEVIGADDAFVDGVLSSPEHGQYVVYALDTGVRTIAYDPGTGTFGKATTFADGNSSGVLDRGHGTANPDRLRATYADGRSVTANVDAGPSSSADPSNLLTWAARGDLNPDPQLLERMAQAFAPELGGDRANVLYQVVFASHKGSVSYLGGQIWRRGDSLAHTFAYAEGGTNGAQVFYGKVTPTNADLVAFVIDSIPGSGTDLLVLVPRPGTGQLSYSPDATTAFSPIANGRSDLNGVGLVERSTTAANDRVEQLDGDGNLDNPIYRGPIAPFLSGDKECG
jgi:hypothetical protein